MCTTTSKRRSKRRRLSSELCTNTSTTPTPRPNWSDLQPDLLELIFEKLPAEDAIRFPAVCHFWELAAKSSVSSTYTPLSQQPPMLIFPSQDMSSRLLFSSARKKVYSITNEFPEDDIVLSSHGWLLTCEKYYKEYTKVIYLFNPLSGARIELPPITDQHRLPVHRAAISADPSRNNNFIVVIVLKLRVDETRMIFLKHGDTEWKDFCWLHDHYDCQVDIMFYEDQLSVVSSDRIVVWDFREKPDPTKNEDFPTITKDFQISGLKIERQWNMSTYRLESQGDIMFVKKVRRRYSFHFYVYRLYDEDKTWEKVESLIGRALFLQEKLSTMALSTRNFPTLLEGNSIYFVEIYEKFKKSKDPSRNMAEIRILQYNLEDKKKPKVYEKFKVKEADHYPPPWILPNPVLHGEKKHKSSETEAD
ncbi:PREDICTED: putative F-box protein At5g66830 [Fragaria vesca subsp. vesca]|uniref:putative F-box protein At5g66830 n=1 Tax=Fragaria vesca subsp. vesca TaxID=101020 RepID=UPI0002C316E7|nr:PREDICTED: putative F-box protein At5g66830 [Fragaria vesca subsp. vesca]